MPRRDLPPPEERQTEFTDTCEDRAKLMVWAKVMCKHQDIIEQVIPVIRTINYPFIWAKADSCVGPNTLQVLFAESDWLDWYTFKAGDSQRNQAEIDRLTTESDQWSGA